MAIDREPVRTLLARLELLESTQPRPEERAIFEVARKALLDEIQRQVQAEGLWLYRDGRGLGAIAPGA